ncbi:lipopolysaccharide transport periplasmic protein LptA [Candidatus Nitrosoglobus terrae]|uniref:Lipopolysaccharide export system protein LptA n=1 Tax=Candidatus Nitrosoglobus terrae TaxID=1630141 RepID=A0A1Q2SPC6_9GAMM|nr:lipopolysaccharide transport periplasmic protein LptA [Candidatus Nitrosoglobus terrae]BAW80990.1 lipopolysaccharide transport periplasmic protein LptA [Candidatus Nitrosoglobus terrae]
MPQQISLRLIIFWLITQNLAYETALAFSNDSGQPIHIEADRGELDNRKQVAIYYGNVHLTQDNLRIDSDTLTIFYTPEKKIKKAIAEGQPAWYRQQSNDDSEDMRAKALKIEYHADNATIYLFQKAHVWQGTNEFTGDRIVYDTEHRIVRGQGSKAGSGRVHVTIRPDEVEPSPNNSNSTPKNSDSTPSLAAPPKNQVADNQQLKSGEDQGRTTDWLALYDSANIKSNQIILLQPRTQVTIINRKDEWLHITTLIKGELLEGWVEKKFIRLPESNTDSISSSPIPIESSKNQVVKNQKSESRQAQNRTTDWLNLYASTDIKSNKVARLQPQTQVTIIDRKDEWLYITALVEGELLEGWAEKKFIQLPETSMNSTHPSPIPIESSKNQIVKNQKIEIGQDRGRTADWLSLYASANIKSNKVALLQPHTQITIIDRKGAWIYLTALVEGELLEGWAEGRFIQLLESSQPK